MYIHQGEIYYKSKKILFFVFNKARMEKSKIHIRLYYCSDHNKYGTKCARNIVYQFIDNDFIGKQYKQGYMDSRTDVLVCIFTFAGRFVHTA